jgi:signal transduction histidine kinase
MQQVFVNLLFNAIHAIGNYGKVTVKSFLDPSGNNIIVEIADTGCGISPENLSKIFDPFFSTKQKGTGLGLALCYGIVRNHQGDIRVNSEINKGTCFTIEIPVTQ